MFTATNAMENKKMQADAIALMAGWSMDDLYDSSKIKSIIPVLTNRNKGIKPYRARNAVYRAAMIMRGAIKRGGQ